MKAGEATDLAVMSGNAIDALIAAGKFAKGSRTDIATSWVAMTVKQGAPKPDISSAEALKRAMLAAQSIAYSTGASVARGEIEIGFQQMSELMPVPGIDIVGGLSKDIEEITFFATGRHADTRVAEAANALTAFFKAPAAHAIIRAKGMEPV